MKDNEIKINYPIAKNHHLIQIAPQFRPIKRGARKRGVERKYVSKNGKNEVTIMMWRELDVADQDLLLTILAIALPIERGKSLDRLIREKNEEKYRELKNKLETKGILAHFDTIVIHTHFYELSKEMGKPINKQTYNWIEESLKRLAGTNFLIKTNNYTYHSNLISYFIENNSKKVEIALNPLNAMVLMNDKYGYILHNRKERIQLKGEVAKALHAVLVGLVNPKSSRTLKIETLIEKVYLEKYENLDKNQKKNYKKAIKKAIENLNQLKNWNIKEFNNETIKINRT